MHARVTTYEDVDLEVAARIQAYVEGLDEDPFAGLPGYRGSLTLLDRENARLIGVGFYDSGGHAREADALLETWPAQVADALPDEIRQALTPRPASVGFYEVVEDVRTARTPAGA